MSKIKVVVAGVGNCCSALVQSIHYHAENPRGLMNYDLGGFKPSDIQVVGGIDIDSRKVGRDLSEAIFAEPNVAPKFCNPPPAGVVVVKGPMLDGADGVLKDVIKVDDSPPVDVPSYLEQLDAEILLCLLPTGAQKAVEFYADSALKAGYAFVNCTPAKIASDNRWVESFEDRGLPLAGDDLMSQMGGTVFHMGVLDFLAKRGVDVTKTYQLDIGGTVEAYGVLEDFRREEKRKIKSEAIKQVLPTDSKVATGTSDYVGFMRDCRTGYFYVEGKNCLGSDVIIDIYLRTHDSANGAGILLDVIRGVKIAIDRGIGGQLTSVSSYGFKNPPIRSPLNESMEWFMSFVKGERKR
ncbi:MAG: inositol-3-phosphate synthase [Candidatus Methanosuratus sp.]|uniref:Inositol-1-phosphate synthase n=1 Tax=Methanosuratincola subterraneus TaxID=2593994 RepID=A0A3S3RMC7_METS7|nr:inositol-3-phosphate synthase [Candidatus Methanosuratincola sp.]RWX73040.1 MAG: Inositol-1-phosphate synthase [Candidatus Methanosuratincola subterraneus]